MQETGTLTAMLPLLGSILPPHDPTRLAFESLIEVMGAVEQGQWSRESDAALQAALGHLEQGGLTSGVGHGMTLMLRMMALFPRPALQRGAAEGRRAGLAVTGRAGRPYR